MKIYFIDEKNKFSSLFKKIESSMEEQVILKEGYSFRTAKSDVVIISGFEENLFEIESLKKYNNLIALVNSKGEMLVNKLATEYNIKDIIYLGCDEDYIAKRICGYISKNFS